MLIKAAYRADRIKAPDLSKQFEIAQWQQGSVAAASLAQMALRQVKETARLPHWCANARTSRGEWRAKDKALIAALSQPSAQRDAAAERGFRNRLAAIDQRIAAIDKTLAHAFPDFTALAGAEPLSIPEIQQQLKPDEALILLLATEHLDAAPEETFIWVVTEADSRLLRSDIGTGGLAREVAALRCGLDAASWSQGTCRTLFGRAYRGAQSRPNTLPFDLARAHRLYTALLEPAKDMIAGKHLLIVPSGPLTQLPFQVLVTAAPDAELSGAQAFREAAWLIADHAITVLPAVSSLKALRAHAHASKAAKSLIGFGNPLLDGDPADADDMMAAKLAASKQNCRPSLRQRIAGLLRRYGGARAI
jgi:hypothetical protein